MAPEVGVAPTSSRLQRGANLPQLLGGACALPLLARQVEARESKAGLSAVASRRRRIVSAGKHFRAGNSLPVIARVLVSLQIVAVRKDLVCHDPEMTGCLRAARRCLRAATIEFWKLCRVLTRSPF